MASILVPSACMALLGVFLAVVTYPILTHRHAWRRATGSRRRRLELTECKEQLYASIKELEFDHSLGKISPQDYEALRGELEVEAVAVLSDLDELEVGGDLEDRIADAMGQQSSTTATVSEQVAAVAASCATLQGEVGALADATRGTRDQAMTTTDMGRRVAALAADLDGRLAEFQLSAA